MCSVEQFMHYCLLIIITNELVYIGMQHCYCVSIFINSWCLSEFICCQVIKTIWKNSNVKNNVGTALCFELNRLTQWCTNSDNIQGVLGEGTLGYKVMLMIYRVCLEKAPWVIK